MPKIPRQFSALIIAATVCACLASAPSTQLTRLPRRRVPTVATTQAVQAVPGVSAQRATLAKIREIYSADYADDSYSARRALARKLIEHGDSTRRDSDAKYIFYLEARDVAAGAGDIPTALDAVDHLIEAFPLPKLPQRLAVFDAAIPVLKSEAAYAAAASMCVDLSDEAVLEADYTRAEQFLDLASHAASKSGKSVYGSWVKSRAIRLETVKRAYDAARPSELKLKTKADDPAASVIFGKYTCLIRKEWDAGLTLLTAGNDDALATLADRDLSCPEGNAADQLAMANAWWEYALSGKSEEAAEWKSRAAFWYRKALPSLDGLDKALAERRALEVATISDPKKKPPRPPDAVAFRGRYYRVSIAEVTWDQARRMSEEAGGRLACLETRIENDAVIKLARGRSLWIGASCDERARWNWLSGKEMFFTYWSTGEPSDSSTQSHVLLGENGAWKISQSRHGFVCEWEN